MSMDEGRKKRKGTGTIFSTEMQNTSSEWVWTTEKNEKTQRKKQERTIFIVDEDPDVHYAEIEIGSSSDIGLEKGRKRITRKGKQGKGKKERRKRKRREKRKEGKEKKRKKKKGTEEVDHTIFSIEMKNGR